METRAESHFGRSRANEHNRKTVMITLTGTFRQQGQVEFDGKKRLKVWLEHTSPRENGTADLKIEELFLPIEDANKLPKQGSEISLSVRVYASGRDVKFSAIGIIGPIKAAA
jgi:hypothetical protein